MADMPTGGMEASWEMGGFEMRETFSSKHCVLCPLIITLNHILNSFELYVFYDFMFYIEKYYLIFVVRDNFMFYTFFAPQCRLG